MEEKTMRILMIGPFPPPIHGMSLANRMLRDGLAERGHQVETLNTHTGTSFGNLKNQGRFTPNKLIGSVSQIFRGIVRILFGPRLDVVYITPAQSEWGYMKYTPFIFSSSIRGIRVFIHIHGGYFRTMYDSSKGWKRWLVKKSLDRISGAIVLGSSLRYMFEGLIGGEKIFICSNAVEEEIFATEDELEWKRERRNRDDTIRIIYLSNLMRKKGILDLLEAVNILKKTGVKVHLDLAGAIEPDIESEVKQYLSQLDTCVTYHGIVKGEEKKRLFLRNYTFCLPTYYPNEGQPIALLEAIVNGCFCVVTKWSGIIDIARPKFSAFTDAKEPVVLAEILKENRKPIFDINRSAFSISLFSDRITEIFKSDTNV
ncbi:MAG: glycosyltransferase family 4 protein [Synergistales bacterium]